MSFAHLHDPSRERTAARNIARALGHWMVMDMTLVARQGAMRVTSRHPAGQTGQLIAWGVLEHVQRGDEFFLIKGHRFDAVCEASRDIAETQYRAAEMV